MNALLSLLATLALFGALFVLGGSWLGIAVIATGSAIGIAQGLRPSA